MVYQMPETLSISKTLKIPRNCHCLQDPDTLQLTHEIRIRKFIIHLDGPTLDLPRTKIKEDSDHFLKSPPDWEIQNLSRVWDLSGTCKACLT